jgi:DNA-binding GntR family transcriptional regulator
MADQGKAQDYIQEHVEARQATSWEREALDLESDAIVFNITHVGWTKDDQAVELTETVLPSDDWVLNYEWPIDQPE